VETVESQDGTRIGFTQTGRGPGLILVQGALGTAYNYRDLAQALSSDFKVYTPDRRGRGMSPRPFTVDHSIQRDVEDVCALSLYTGAPYIFGLSSGAVIALTCVAQLDSLRKAVIYEPPFYFDHGIDERRVERFNQEVGDSLFVEAMTTAGEIVKLAPLPIRLMPRFLNSGNGYADLDELLPAMRYDFRVVGEMSQRLSAFRSVDKPILLLGGTRVPGYLKHSLAELEKTLPKARRTTFRGLDHSAPWNAERGGAPLIVADAIRFFLK
jgi:pimeloyl-ACP methyl ester carboxylesterase